MYQPSSEPLGSPPVTSRPSRWPIFDVAQHLVELALVDHRGDLSRRILSRPLAQRLRPTGHSGEHVLVHRLEHDRP